MTAPPTAAQLIEQGLFHHRQGDLAVAMERYTQVLRNDPGNADALYYIAVIACHQGQFQQGIELARRSLTFRMGQARAHNLIGKAYERLHQPLEALKSYDAAIAIDRDFAEAHGNRAAILADADLPEEALKSFERAIALDPNSLADRINRGSLLSALGRHAEALADFDKAFALSPEDADVMLGRADQLGLLERYQEAEAAYDEIIARYPKFALAIGHKGLTVKQTGRFAEARQLLTQALEMNRDDHATAFALGRLMLQMGDWREAWPLLERRAFMPKPTYKPLDYPRWRGEPPDDFRLVLMSEQGLGDTVHFGRYAALLAGRGHAVTLLTLPVLAPLMRTLQDVEQVISSVEELARDTRRILWLPLMSTPGALHLTPDTIPEQGAYLSADPARVKRLGGQLGGGFKVGILWHGVTNAAPLTAFAPLAAIPGLRLISLQKGAAARQIDSAAFGARIERPLDADDLSPEALLDTAALMANLDLIVTIESMPAHLAGALGRHVFLALRHVPDWRWLTDGETTRWYPTMRLFRQDASRQWAPVFERIAAAVREQVG